MKAFSFKTLIQTGITQLVSGIFLSVLFLLLASEIKSQVPMIRLQMKGPGSYLDETILYYQEGASAGFDSEFDAYKISGPNTVPTISQEYNTTLLQINGVSPVTSTFSINIKTTTNVSGTFTLTATDVNFLPVGTCVSLFDQLNSTSVNILNGPYIFTLSPVTSGLRFVLNISHFDLPVQAQVLQPVCNFPQEGSIKLKGQVFSPWNYTWKDTLGNVLRTRLNSMAADSLSGLNSGVYRVEISSLANACYSHTGSYSITPTIQPVISFSAPDTIIASSIINFTPQNLSSNCEFYQWTFGNSANIYNDFEPGHSYSFAGDFESKLVGISSTGCRDSVSKMIHVVDFATAINNEIKNNVELLSLGDNLFLVKPNQQSFKNLAVEIFNLEGKTVLMKSIHHSNTDEKILLDCRAFSSGIYLTKISADNQPLKQGKIIVN
ncbi:MAG: hypothetical protein K0R26_794 [Bacteroidota bacterium]|jgi:hypothetical protein|nr:hypothetical protein [Bacteroidota bacterium]